MKTLIPIVIGLLVVGCGKKEQPNAGEPDPTANAEYTEDTPNEYTEDTLNPESETPPESDDKDGNAAIYKNLKEEIVRLKEEIRKLKKETSNFKSQYKKLTLKERVAGSYEPYGDFEPGFCKYVFHENGKFENWQNGKIVEASKWKIVRKEIHVDDFESDTYIYIIESNGNLTEIAVISDGKRQGLPKGRYKKLK